MAYANGKYAKFISDRSGMEYPYTEMVKEWNGSRVHKSEFEPKTPQDNPKRHTSDAEALQNSRPDRTENVTERLLPRNAFTYAAGETVIKIYEPGHGRTTGDTVRFRNVTGANEIVLNSANDSDGRTITVIDDDFYSYSVGLAPSTTTIFGGDQASSGPVTVSN